MKKNAPFLLLLPVALALLASSCARVSVTEAMSRLYRAASLDSTLKQDYRRIAAEWPDRPYASEEALTATEYLTLLAGGCVGEKHLEIIGEEGRTALVAELPGRKKKEGIILICADITTEKDSSGVLIRSDEASCMAAVEVLRLFKAAKITPDKTVHVVIRQKKAGSEGLGSYVEWLQERKEAGHDAGEVLLQVHLGSDGSLDPATFYIGEPGMIFEKIREVLPPLFSPYGTYGFASMPRFVDHANLPAPYYRYRVTPETLAEDAAAVASLAFIN